MDREFHTTYMADVFERIMSLGGMFNAHLHLDRAETLGPTLEMMRAQGNAAESSLAIAQKHALTPLIPPARRSDSFGIPNLVKV